MPRRKTLTTIEDMVVQLDRRVRRLEGRLERKYTFRSGSDGLYVENLETNQLFKVLLEEVDTI